MSNGRAAWPGSSLWPADSARMMSNAPNASGLSGISQPPAIAASTRPSRRSPERLAERDRARRARVGGRQDRPADVERDAEVGRRRAAEDGQREVRRDRRMPLLEVALVLLLGVGDAAERRAEVDPDPLRVAPRRRRPGVSPASSSASRPATSPNWLNRSSWRAVFGGIQASGSKSSTWAATCERNGLGSKRSMRLTGERPARRPARNASTPGARSAVMTPMPVIQMRRRSVMAEDSPASAGLGLVGEGLGERLERRQRPAGDRPREDAVDERREARRAAAGSRARSRRACRPPSGSIRQVTSIPLVAPATWTKRSRRVAGSVQVRDRQATGSPSPRTPISGRRATKSTTSEPSGRARRARDRA